MRRALDRLYGASLVAAAILLCAIAVIVLIQVTLNILDDIAGALVGAPVGLLIPSYAEFTGFFLAGASFLALAGTLRNGGHIRVTLLIHHLGENTRRTVELWVLFVAFLFAAYFTWYAGALTIESLAFDDRADGMVATPLWIPQLVMALGALVLAIALADEYLRVAQGHRPSYMVYETSYMDPEEEWATGQPDKAGDK